MYVHFKGVYKVGQDEYYYGNNQETILHTKTKKCSEKSERRLVTDGRTSRSVRQSVSWYI